LWCDRLGCTVQARQPRHKTGGMPPAPQNILGILLARLAFPAAYA
jgi:hypothetical protein